MHLSAYSATPDMLGFQLALKNKNNRQLAPWKNTEKYTENIRIFFWSVFGPFWSKLVKNSLPRAREGFQRLPGCIGIDFG